MNEGVVIRKKYAEPGMRVIPAHDAFIRIVLILDLVNVFPSVLRERDVSPRLRRIQPRDARGDAHSATIFCADQHSTDFRFAVRASVLPYLAKHFAFNRHPWLSLIRFSFTHFSDSYENLKPKPSF